MTRPVTIAAILVGLLAVCDAGATEPRREQHVVREWRDGRLVVIERADLPGQSDAKEATGGSRRWKLTRERVGEQARAELVERFRTWSDARRLAAEAHWNAETRQFRAEFDNKFSNFLRKFEWSEPELELEDGDGDGDGADSDAIRAAEDSLSLAFQEIAALETRAQSDVIARLAKRLAEHAENLSEMVPEPPQPPHAIAAEGTVPVPMARVAPLEAFSINFDVLDDLAIEEISRLRKSRSVSVSNVEAMLPVAGALFGSYVILRGITNRRVRLATRPA